MNYYFTFNDSYSGVYHSQVIDVVKLYQTNGVQMQLIAFVSPRSFFKDKRSIKQFIPDAIVLPSIPKLSNWKKNKYLLKLVVKPKSKIICRGIFATNIALELKSNFSEIIYDGRGAIKAEQNEYGVYNGTGIENAIEALELNAVLKSDKQIAVSTKLIKYWEKEYGYSNDENVIIPCSIADNFKKQSSVDLSLLPGLNSEDILLIYSGSLAGWQALDNLEEILSSLMINKNIKVLFLSQSHKTIKSLEKKYPNKIYRKWLSPTEVPKYLALGDYGLLLRNSNDTNRVASPVKFAEYLSAGLKVLISEDIGDFSEMVKDNNLGFVINDSKIENIMLESMRASALEKERIRKFAIDNFSKEAVSNKYLEMMHV